MCAKIKIDLVDDRDEVEEHTLHTDKLTSPLAYPRKLYEYYS
jgi:hypothetical protein